MCPNPRLRGTTSANNAFLAEETALRTLNEKKHSVKTRMNEGGLLYAILESFKLCATIFHIHVVQTENMNVPATFSC